MMDELSNTLVAEARKVHLVANTPRYLYKHIIDTQLYDRINKWSPKRLADLFVEAVSSNNPGVAYCALVALIDNLPNGVAVELPGEDLKWVSDIIEIAETKLRSDTSLEVDASRQPTRGWRATPSGSTSDADFESEGFSSSTIIEA